MFKLLNGLLQEVPFALYIRDDQVSAIQVVSSSKQAGVESLAQADLPKGVVVEGEIKNKDQLAKTINNMLSAAKPVPIRSKQCIVTLPSGKTFEHSLYISKKVPEQNIVQIINDQLEKTIPLSLGDMRHDRQKLALNSINVYFVSVAEKQYLNEYERMLKADCDLRPVVFEPEAISLIRNIPVDLKKDYGNIVITARNGFIAWYLIWHGNIYDSNTVSFEEFAEDLSRSTEHYKQETKRDIKSLIMLTSDEDKERILNSIEHLDIAVVTPDRLNVAQMCENIDQIILAGAGLRAIYPENNEINLA